MKLSFVQGQLASLRFPISLSPHRVLHCPCPTYHRADGTAFFSTVRQAIILQREWQEQNLGTSSIPSLIPAASSWSSPIFSLPRASPQFCISSPNPVLLLLSVVLPGWLCGKEPGSQACFCAVRRQKPYLQSNAEPPRSHALLFGILSYGSFHPLSTLPQALPLQ